MKVCFCFEHFFSATSLLLNHLNAYIQCSILFFLDYSTFANIQITKNGYRRLIVDGYMFGEARFNTSKSNIRWRCTHNGLTGTKRVRCNCYISTKVVHKHLEYQFAVERSILIPDFLFNSIRLLTGMRWCKKSIT